MTIKTKLIANALLTAVIIVAITVASFLLMQFVKGKITDLTEKSTPLQIRTVELQRELQASVTALVKVNAAQTMAEYTTSRAAAEKSLGAVAIIQRTFEQLDSSSKLDGMVELFKIAQELFRAVEDRLHSNAAAVAANAKVLQSMQVSSSRLNDLDLSIQKLQIKYAKAFAASLEKTNLLSRKIQSIEDLRNMSRELQLIAVTVQVAKNNTALLLARARLKTVSARMVKNEYYISNPSLTSAASTFTGNLDEYIKLHAATLTRWDDDSATVAAAYGKELSYKLNNLFQTLDQDILLENDELRFANTSQGVIFSQSNSANSVLVANSELVAMGARITGKTSRLFTLQSAAELKKFDADIRSQFSKIQALLLTVEKALTGLQAREELQMLRAASASLTAIRTEIYTTDGIVTKLKKKLNAIEQANQAAEKLHDIVARQTAKGNASVAAARNEQNRSVVSVHTMINRSLLQIAIVGAVTILITALLGLWVYRSVLRPLRVVLRAVRSQQEKGQEKATLAASVANGDLSQEVTVSEAIALDPHQMTNDEMGMVLQAVAGMSETQVSLDRAFAGMTESLRNGRDEEHRRDHLKSGLHEFNKILRGDHDIQVLSEYALAFMAAFLDASVAIIYLYNEEDQMLRPLTTYAISLAGRPQGGAFMRGEGLVGQVASERKMVHLKTVPQGYLPIASALGEADPLQIAILPIIHNDILTGVLELGSFKPFSGDDFEFLQQGLEGIAIAITANRSHQLVSELLEQTRSQAEELRLQQEELQQTNEELEERARLLEERAKPT